MLAGKRTYISLGVIFVHQLLKTLGYDLPQEQFSSAIDVLSGIAAFFFRAIAKPKEKLNE